MLEVRVLKAAEGAEEGFTTQLRRLLLGRKDVLVTNPVPVIHFHFLNSDRLRRQIQTPSQHYGLILTSPRCVESIHNCIVESSDFTKDWESYLKEAWRSKPTFCVGPGTVSNILKLYGMTEQDFSSCTNFIVSQVGNSEDLAQLILKEADTNPTQLPLLYPCGSLKTDALGATLTKASVQFEALTVYQTVKHPELENILKSIENPSDAEKNEIVYVFFSPSGIKFSLPYLQNLSSKYLVAIGPTTRAELEKIPNLEGKKIHQCANPTPEALADVVSKIADEVSPKFL